MIHGEVIGSVWSSVKVAGLDHRKLLLVRPIDHGAPSGVIGTIVAVDCVHAGKGDHVIVALGKAARNAIHQGADLPIEAAVVAICDGWEAGEGSPSSATKKKATRKRTAKKKKKKKATTKAPPKAPSIDETGQLFEKVFESAPEAEPVPEAKPESDEPAVILEEDAELPGFEDVDGIWDSVDDGNSGNDNDPSDSTDEKEV